MTILFYIPHLSKGGPNRVFFELAKGLFSLGYTVIVLTNNKGGVYWDSLPVGIHKMSLDTHKKYPIKSFAKTVQKLRPTIIFCTLSCILTATFARLFFALRVVLVIRPANHFTQNTKLLLKKNKLKHSFSAVVNVLTFYLADHIVCQSTDLFSDYRRYGIQPQKMSVIANPIDVTIQTSLSRNSGVTLVAAGRLLNEQKGFDILLHALPPIIKMYPNVTLYIYGEGPDRIFLNHLVHELNLSRNVFFPGHQENLIECIAKANFFICPSHTEAFPNAVLESISIGVPVIARNSSAGIRNLVVPELTGWLCSTGSAEELSQTIIQAIEAPALDAIKIKEFVATNFATSVIAQKYATLVHMLVSN